MRQLTGKTSLRLINEENFFKIIKKPTSEEMFTKIQLQAQAKYWKNCNLVYKYHHFVENIINIISEHYIILISLYNTFC